LRWLGGVVAVVLVAVIVLAPSWRNYYLRRGTVRIIEDVVYVAGSTNPKHRLDLYLPTAIRTGPASIVVFVHGGFWRPMDRRLLQPFTGLHGCVGVALANRGVATAVVGYRQYPEAATVEAALDDVARAVRYVIDNVPREIGGDPAHVYLVGHSAGGFLTTLLALAPEHLERAGVRTSQLSGFVSMAGVYDLARVAAALEPDLGARVRASAADAEGLRRFSPEQRVRADHPPMLLLVGTGEPPAGRVEHDRMYAALRAVPGDVTQADVPGADHMDLVMHLSHPNDRAMSELFNFIEHHRL
jgi:acetyl esterase/lipase